MRLFDTSDVVFVRILALMGAESAVEFFQIFLRTFSLSSIRVVELYDYWIFLTLNQQFFRIMFGGCVVIGMKKRQLERFRWILKRFSIFMYLKGCI